MTQYKKSGGPRANAGRNKIEDKKVQVPLYLKQSRVDLLGKVQIKRLCAALIEKEYTGRLREQSIQKPPG